MSKVENGRFSKRPGPKVTIIRVDRRKKPRANFDSREFIEDVFQGQKAVLNREQAMELITFVIERVKQDLRKFDKYEERCTK